MTSRVRMFSKPVEEDSEYDEDNQRKLYETELNEDELHEELLCGDEILDAADVGEHDEMEYLAEHAVYKASTTRRVIKPRKRRRATEKDSRLDHEIDYTATNYYHRYKNKSYVRRNDVGKYCQVCKAKRLGVRSRGLPSDLQLRKLWILRFNLEPERAAELWVKDAFSDNSHSGEVCSIHFPECDDDLRTCRELLPLDMRPPHLINSNADDVDFGNMVLTCVFCSSRRTLKSMIPFVRARSRRRRWISALSNGDSQCESELREALKNGATKFLCDWHFADSCFSVNTYGEWKLRKDALPNPTLEENDRTSMRVYMINHLDSKIQREEELRRRRINFLMLKKHAKEKERVDKENTRAVIDKMRRTFPGLVSVGLNDHHVYNDHGSSVYNSTSHGPQRSDETCSSNYIEIDPDMPLLYADETDGLQENYNQEPTTSTSVLDVDYFEDYVETDVEYSDDSDFELEIIRRMQSNVDVIVSKARHCEFCHVVVSSDKSKTQHRPRTWPYDDVKHEKYLSIMGWPKQFEEEIRRLWVRRRIEPLGVSPGTVYKYPTLTICQGHLEDAGIPEQIESWLSKYCVLCDEELGDKNLLLPFPVEQSSRISWARSLFSKKPCNTLLQKQQQWLRERLTRAAATHYRLCLFHFPKTSFLESLDCFYFEQSSQPLSLNICQYARIPRGPHGVVKCPLCDTWNIESETTQIRTPRGAAERNFLVEMLISGDKPTLRKGVGKLSAEASTICKMHLPDLDPFELIAERKLVASVTVQCVVCSRFDLAQNMTPFPYDAAKRTMWVDSMSRRRGNRMRLLNRLSLEGRHYICPRHFHPNSLRYIPGLGVFKKLYFLPIPDPNEQPITHVPEPQEDDYIPLLVDGFDNEKVQWHLNYDKVTSIVGDIDDEESTNVVVDEMDYVYQEENVEPEREADVDVADNGDSEMLVEGIPTPYREEIVVTQNLE
ncbi:hypothetical protein Angca_000272 [Angiostrongylus cantonensis]|nr:hypothetical protein Angca_000272 [Angiostrongylus cantonensis]